MNNTKIVIIEDEPATQKVMELILNRAGYSDLKVFSALQPGFDYISSNEVDLVISDIRMDGLDGAFGARKLREVTDIPVIFHSSMPEEYLKMQSRQVRNSAFVHKSSNPDELLKKIAEVLKE